MTTANLVQAPAAHAAERQGLVTWAAGHFGVDAGKVFPILKATCFKGADNKEASDAEVAALLIVAREHKLNPFLREIFAFPDKKGGIVPVVGVDGWTRIVNGHPMYSGVKFIYAGSPVPEWIECHIFRKDRQQPIEVRELMAECRRDTMPWKSHPSRMLRHKAFIQCARLAFGFAGIFDEDEAERIVVGEVVSDTRVLDRGAAGLKKALVDDPAGGAGSGTITHDDPTPLTTKPKGDAAARDKYIAKFGECKDGEILDLVMDEIRLFEWSADDQAAIDKAYTERAAALGRAS